MEPTSPEEHMFLRKLKSLGEEKVKDDLLHNRYAPRYKALAEQWLKTRNEDTGKDVSNKTLRVNIFMLIIAMLAFTISILFYFYPQK